MNRRRFLKYAIGSCAGVGIASCVYSVGVEPHWVEYVERDLPIRNLPHALAGRTLVQLSDLHIGPDVDDKYLIEHFERIKSLAPDIVVVTGDFLTCHETEEIDHAARVLDHLPHGKLATAGILGNHDYGRGYRVGKVADQLTERAAQQGIHILRNQTRNINGLTLAGVEDMWGPCWQSGHVLEWLNADDANLVMCHNPDTADCPVWNGYQGWLLCGHTHGGQIRFPGCQPLKIPVKNKRYVAGAYDLFDGRKMYINRGLGHLLRVRFNVRPEVTIFTLRRDDSPLNRSSAPAAPEPS